MKIEERDTPKTRDETAKLYRQMKWDYEALASVDSVGEDPHGFAAYVATRLAVLQLVQQERIIKALGLIGAVTV